MMGALGNGRAGLGLLLGLAALMILVCLGRGTAALEPEEVVVVANSEVAGSEEVAQYYLEQRDLPQGNLLVVEAPTSEIINRTQYNTLEAAINSSIRAAGLEDSVQALVLVYGMPLKVSSGDEGNSSGSQASVDSELALLYSSLGSGGEGYCANPYYQARGAFQRDRFDEILLVTRLDGPAPEVVNATIDRTILAEQMNQVGWAYFDTDPDFEPDNSEVREYDDNITLAYELSRAWGLDAAIEETGKDIGQAGARWNESSSVGTELANGTVSLWFYWGWYDDPIYHDTFNWTLGATGQRVHSLNARSMHDDTWVTGALSDNLTGTAGHVWEPWLETAARPQSVLAHLLDGYTLAEAFWRGTPALGFQNVVLGDPLYTPVRADLRLEQLGERPRLSPGENRTLELELTNLGPLRQKAELRVTGLPEGLEVDIMPNSMTLNSSATLRVSVTLNLSSDPLTLEAGNRTFHIVAESLTGPHQLVNLSVRVEVAPVARLGMEEYLLEGLFQARPGDNATLAFNLTNLGNGPARVLLGLGLPSVLANATLAWQDPVDSSNQTVVNGTFYLPLELGYRGRRLLVAELALPFDMGLLAGSGYELSVEVRSTSDHTPLLSASLPLRILAYWNLSVRFPAEPVALLAGDNRSLAVKLTNTGNTFGNVSLAFLEPPGEPWLNSVTGAPLWLPPGHNRTLLFGLNLSESVAPGLHDLSYSLRWGELRDRGNLTFQVSKLDLSLEELYFAPRDLPRAGERISVGTRVRTNLREWPGSATLVLESPSFTTPISREFSFRSGYTDEIYLELELPAGELEMTLRVEVPRGLYDANRSNDRLVFSRTIAPAIDARILEHTLKPYNLTRLSFTVTSIPKAEPATGEPSRFELARPLLVRVFVNGVSQKDILFHGPTAELEFRKRVNDENVTIEIWLDVGDWYNETDETNNVLKVTYHPEPEPERDPPGGSSGIDIWELLASYYPVLVLMAVLCVTTWYRYAGPGSSGKGG